MGCSQSFTSRKSAPSRGQPAPPAGEAPVLTEVATVLTEVTAEERALTQLKLIFDAIDASGDGIVSKAELTAALEKNHSLGALVKEAGLNQEFYILNQLDSNEDHRVTWDEFQSHLKNAAVQQVEEIGNLAAAERPVEEKVLKQLRELFDGLDVDADGAVSREELVMGLEKGKDEQGLMKDDTLGKLVEQAGFDPHWNTLAQLDTDKDGRITWEEFEAHLRGAANREVQEHGDIAAAVVVEEHTVTQTCFGCC